MKTLLPISVFLISSTNAWPGYKSKPVLRDDENCIETNHVHNECGPVKKPNIERVPGVQYPSAFIMQYDQWNIECALDDLECMPPYYPSAPEKLKDKFPIVNGPGFTYYNSTYRGGS